MAPIATARAPDAAFILLLTCAYLIALVFALPPSELLRAVGCTILLAATLHWVGNRLRDKPMTSFGTLGTGFIACAILVFPTLTAFGGAGRAAALIGFIGAQICLLVWCSARWGVRVYTAPPMSLRSALTMAALFAVALSVLATIPIIARALTRDEGIELLGVYLAYFVGAAGAAIVYWALQRFRHLATGRYAIGLLGGMCCYGAVAPVASVLERKPFDPTMALVVAFIAGGLVGPALMFDSKLADVT